MAKFKKLKETWIENRSSNNWNSKINYSQNVNKNTYILSGCTNRLHTVYVQIMILYDSVISRIWKGHVNMINDVLKGHFSLLKKYLEDNCIISRLDLLNHNTQLWFSDFVLLLELCICRCGLQPVWGGCPLRLCDIIQQPPHVTQAAEW